MGSTPVAAVRADGPWGVAEPSRQDIVLALKCLCSHIRTPRILCVGDATGPVALQMAVAGAEITVSDPLVVALNECRNQFADQGLSLSTIHTDPTRLSCSGDGPYDVVFTMGVLERYTTDEQREVMERFSDLITSDGFVVAFEQTRGGSLSRYFDWMDQLGGAQTYPKSGKGGHSQDVSPLGYRGSYQAVVSYETRYGGFPSADPISSRIDCYLHARGMDEGLVDHVRMTVTYKGAPPPTVAPCVRDIHSNRASSTGLDLVILGAASWEDSDDRCKLFAAFASFMGAKAVYVEGSSSDVQWDGRTLPAEMSVLGTRLAGRVAISPSAVLSVTADGHSIDVHTQWTEAFLRVHECHRPVFWVIDERWGQFIDTLRRYGLVVYDSEARPDRAADRDSLSERLLASCADIVVADSEMSSEGQAYRSPGTYFIPFGVQPTGWAACTEAALALAESYAATGVDKMAQIEKCLRRGLAAVASYPGLVDELTIAAAELGLVHLVLDRFGPDLGRLQQFALMLRDRNRGNAALLVASTLCDLYPGDGDTQFNHAVLCLEAGDVGLAFDRLLTILRDYQDLSILPLLVPILDGLGQQALIEQWIRPGDPPCLQSCDHETLRAFVRELESLQDDLRSRGEERSDMKGSLHIGVYKDALTMGGAETHVLSLVRGLVDRGHRVSVTCPDLGTEMKRYLVDAGASITDTLPLDLDVLHIHPFESIPHGVAFGRVNRIPTVTTYHGPYATYLEQAVITGPAIAVSREVRDLLRRVHPGEYPVVENGIDLKEFYPGGMHSSRRVLFVGRLDARQVFVVELCKAFSLRGMELLVVGDPIPPGYEAESFFVGARWDMGNLMRTADIVLATGRGVREAMACGCVSIVCNHGAFGGIVTPSTVEELIYANFSGRGGVQPDPDAIALLCQDLLDDTSRLVELRSWSAEYAKEHFQLEKMIDQTLAVYQEAIRAEGQRL